MDNEKERTKELGSTVSLNVPQTGQSRRSSNNFRLDKSDTGFVRWEVSDSEAGFAVSKSKIAANDTTPYSYLINGSSVPEVSDGIGHYIATPCDAQPGAFTVKAYEGEANTYRIACRHKPLEGQSHRASDNFTCGGKISCPEGITFKVRKDKSAATDSTLIEEAKNGTVIVPDGQMYFADPQGATAPFLVTIIQ